MTQKQPNGVQGKWWGKRPNGPEWRELKGRLKRMWGGVDSEPPISNLRGIIFKKIDLGDTNFIEIDFSYADFSSANYDSNLTGNKSSIFRSCNFTSAKFSRATFVKVHFQSCVFTETIFFQAKFEGCSFDNCKFDGCRLFQANFEGAHLRDNLFTNCDCRKIVWGVSYSPDQDHPSFTMFDHCDLGNAYLNKANIVGGIEFKECNKFEYAALMGSTYHSVTFTNCNLDGADLSRSRFADSRFNNSEFGKSNLYYATFGSPDKPTDMTGMSFEGSDTRGINMENAIGLEITQFRGLNLEAAVLPQHIAGFPIKDAVLKAAGYARKLFTPIVLFCVFLVACSFLLPYHHKVKILNFDFMVTALTLAWIAPVILLLWQSVFLFYMNRLWETIDRLPAVFPDGSKTYEYPDLWINVNYIRLENPSYKKELSCGLKELLICGHWRAWLAVFFIWFVVPLTILVSVMGFIWYGSIGLNCWLLFLFLTSLAQVLWSQGQAAALLGSIGWYKKIKMARVAMPVLLAVVLIVFFVEAIDQWYASGGSILY